MGTYEKLIYLATEPFDSELVLCDEKGNKLKSSLVINIARLSTAYIEPRKNDAFLRLL